MGWVSKAQSATQGPGDFVLRAIGRTRGFEQGNMIRFLLQKDDQRIENKLEMIGWLKEDSSLAKQARKKLMARIERLESTGFCD